MEDELDEFLYGQDNLTTKDEPKVDTEEDVHMSANVSEHSDGSDAESEDELEIVLDETGNDIHEEVSTEQQYSNHTLFYKTSRRSALQFKSAVEDEKEDELKDTMNNEQILDEVVPLKGHINVNAIGELEGKSILEVDIDQIEDKPWRQPGADITDYFNYGFQEDTWRAYCIKQKQLREDNTLKKMAYEMPELSQYQEKRYHRDRSRSPRRREPSVESYSRRRDSSRDRRREASRDRKRDYGRDYDRRRRY